MTLTQPIFLENCKEQLVLVKKDILMSKTKQITLYANHVTTDASIALQQDNLLVHHVLHQQSIIEQLVYLQITSTTNNRAINLSSN